MPLLDISTPQYSFRNNLYSINFQRIHHVSFTSSNPKTVRWRYFHNSDSIQLNRGRLMIQAVATLEPVCSGMENDTAQQLPVPVPVPVPSTGNLSSAGDQPPVEDEKEVLRRNRISKANKGREAWNKGLKHSPETRQKIRERTKLAMRTPQVKMKLMKGIHNQTRETRERISAAVRLTWDRRRFSRRMMARCHREWLDLIAEASKKGLSDEGELQWDSHEIISKQLEKEFKEGIESRKQKRGTGLGQRAPKTLEQRKKISEAIAAKWADPAYRDKVYCGIAKHRGKDPETRDPEWGSKKKEPKKVKPERKFDPRIKSQRPKMKTSIETARKEPKQARFKDPQARYKLEMIKSIRAQRAASDPKISEAILRANVLISEAQRAAEALEAAAAKSPMAEASLMETRKLIAEAISYIKSIETGNSGTSGTGFDNEEIVEGVNEIEQKGVNGVGGVEIGKFGEVSLPTNVNGTEHVHLSSSSSSSSSWSDLNLHLKKVESGGGKGEKVENRGGKSRRWVCGRLVEDENEDEEEL